MKIPNISSDQPFRIWAFVIGLNIVGLIGLFYLKAQGIDLYSFRGGG